MPRIRSVHADQWTDEQFVSCSPCARLLALGIRNFADDGGVFEWKPITIKMRILPVDNIDIEALLGELIATNQIQKYSVGGKEYGIIRNFTKFQRPKKPVHCFPVPNQDMVKEDPVPNQFPTSSPPVPHQYGNSSADGEVEVEVEKKEKETLRVSKKKGVFEVQAVDVVSWLADNPKITADPDWELGKFQDHWRGKKPKDLPSDGIAAFRNWLRKATEFKAQATPPPPQEKKPWTPYAES